MSDLLELVRTALRGVRPKPEDTATQDEKRRYSEQMSAWLARALAEALRQLGLPEVRPAPPGLLDSSGAERRLSGGLGAKRVDVSWATEESGLLLGVSIKTINFRDRRTGNFQKNLTNRRGDMLFEAVTLHQRFPYASLFGLLCLDIGAASDGTAKRRSTFENAHPRLRLFTGRNDPAGRTEQFERFFVALVDTEQEPPTFRLFSVGQPEQEILIQDALQSALSIVVERNPDFYQLKDGRLTKAD